MTFTAKAIDFSSVAEYFHAHKAVNPEGCFTGFDCCDVIRAEFQRIVIIDNGFRNWRLLAWANTDTVRPATAIAGLIWKAWQYPSLDVHFINDCCPGPEVLEFDRNVWSNFVVGGLQQSNFIFDGNRMMRGAIRNPVGEGNIVDVYQWRIGINRYIISPDQFVLLFAHFSKL